MVSYLMMYLLSYIIPLELYYLIAAMYYQEQEARTSVLRQRAEERASASGEPTSSSKQVAVSQESKHINFWSDLEQGVSPKFV